MTHIAVLDIGKTNAKLVLVHSATLAEIAMVTRPNTVLLGPPYPHYDLDGLWAFFASGLRDFHARFGIDAISITTHGAAAVLLDANGNLAAPMLDYEHSGPDDLAAAYNALRPDFAVTGSARLPMGLNLGAQLFWLLQNDPSLRGRTAYVLTYPQYWGWRLTGQMACDVCSLGCHTDLWNPWAGAFSPLVQDLGLAGKFAAPRAPSEILGTLRGDIARALGLPQGIPVAVGIHDSNASLYPYLLAQEPPFSVVSSGTWTVSMAIGGAQVALDSARDVLVNVGGQGQAVPSARFMGGREFDLIAAGETSVPSGPDRARVLANQIAILPAAVPQSGPFAGQTLHWTQPPQTGGEKMAALAWYLALMTRTCLDLIGARGPVIVEGPLGSNADYLDMLSAQSDGAVQVAKAGTGTTGGAVCLITGHAPSHLAQPWPVPKDAVQMQEYAEKWRNMAQARRS